MSYKKLEVWKLSKEVVVIIHEMTLNLPHFELFETGSQIRRSSKSIRSNIVEGYGRRRYKQDFIRFLIYAHSSVDETRDHLEVLFETKSLKNKETFTKVSKMLDMLGKKLYLFIKSVENNHNSNF
jgi:four helix bundle protein